MTADIQVFNQKFQALYSDHHGWLKSWLRRRLGCSEHAADLTHDTFIRLLSTTDATSSLDAIREPRTYLATIANRVMLDHFRRKALERAYLQMLEEQSEPESISLETRAIIFETLCQVDAMLTGLGPKVRRAFLLSQLEGVHYADIALQLSVSVSSVKKYIAKATEQCLLFALESELR